jgi:predicted DNA-binding transcriptional regulator YafY
MQTSTVRRLIETGKTFVIVYADADNNISERIVDVEYVAGTLFAGHCRLRDARRCFCFERVLFAAEWNGRPLVTFAADRPPGLPVPTTDLRMLLAVTGMAAWDADRAMQAVATA